MNLLADALALFAALALGLMAGALLAEGAVLVPFWRGQEAAAFLTWYRRHASLLQRFFGALEVTAVLLTVAAAALAWFVGGEGQLWLTAAAVLGIAVLAVFPIYFARANASFAAATIEPGNVADELRRWSAWHWARTAAAIGASAASLGALAV